MRYFGNKEGICKCYRTVVFLSLVVLWASAVNAAEPEEHFNNTPQQFASAEKMENKTLSVFNRAEPVDIANMRGYPKLSLRKNWYQLPITRKKGMFNPVFLPFKYVCRSGDKDLRQSMTFPCLLSFKFDFVPDNFSARHPGFIYRKKPIWKVQPNETEKVRKYISYWEATHAIGGTLVQDKEGYTGKLLVFDRSGKEILNREYNEPTQYFVLMGQMVKPWMDSQKQNVSEGLYNELVRSMTTDMKCVKLYGQSFDVPWRSEEEWALYETILNQDPDFAEVRFWYANQKGWTLDSHSAEYAKLKTEKGKALKSHLVIPALNEFDFKGCPDKALVAECRKVLDYAVSICDENISVISAKLSLDGHRLPLKKLDAFLPIVQKYPCGYRLIIDLGWEYRRRGYYEKSIPLYLSAIQSGYLKGTGRFDWEWMNLAWDFSDLGYPDESIYCGTMAFSDCSRKNLPYVYWKLGTSYKERNHYAGAAQMFQYWQALKKEKRGDLYAFLSSCQGGSLSLLKNSDKLLKSISEHPFKKARIQLANGLYDEAEKTMKEVKLDRVSREDLLEAYMIYTDIYLLSGKLKNARKYAVYAWSVSPRSRQVAYLLTQALQEDKTALARYAKVTLFLCKEDPYWKSLSADLRDVPEESDETVMELYHDIKNKLNTTSNADEYNFWRKFDPFEIEYICMTLLEQSETTNRDEILKFYLRYRAAVSRISKWQKAHTRIFFLQLLQLIPREDRQSWMPSLK